MKATVQQSYITLRGLNLGKHFVNENKMQPGRSYPMTIDGLPEIDDVEGTLDRSGFIGGLAVLYRNFDLAIGDEVDVSFDGTILRLGPPIQKRRQPATTPVAPATVTPTEPPKSIVFEKRQLKHIHIEIYAPGNLNRWIPQLEPDVYLVFGALAQYTDYEYCSGASQGLLDKLGYTAETKPDAILIDRSTREYLMAEFKMKSSAFAGNHHKDDVDVLVCWEDDEKDRTKLPERVVHLRQVLEAKLEEGEIDL